MRTRKIRFVSKSKYEINMADFEKNKRKIIEFGDAYFLSKEINKIIKHYITKSY